MRNKDAFSIFIMHSKYFSLSVIGLIFQLALTKPTERMVFADIRSQSYCNRQEKGRTYVTERNGAVAQPFWQSLKMDSQVCEREIANVLKRDEINNCWNKHQIKAPTKQSSLPSVLGNRDNTLGKL